ncbi:Eco57I restriction-modification methylase domain-containing protein [Tenacibaculum sp. IB213877]|uniref:Eco57I restriction-modification methylase domain-containing protein n=1 Tax=Tenacibaculum sp. IB213877 TaxID=3097351 RepID=UPI002A5AD771|nr:TaqI-like C-terminal specificity domain-containing protein [Tenacibaculum sp. IB213877]MDY0779964.1 TaqI-like C-terminal specificity domain-containing protein [Tenacibaculum sp. IB213877]
MKRDKLKDILQSNYNRGEWRNVLTFLSGNKNLLKPRLEPKEIVLTTQKATNIVKHLFELGTLETTDGVTLPIFEIELQDNIKIEYNKVGVNQLIKEYILKDAGNGAIATYHYANQDKTEWRFSFISKFGGSEFFDEVEDVETNPKKYTYIFGTPEEHRTALERLYNLEQSRFRLEDFFEAFNVEPVSNNFFKEYKNFYLDFVSHLSSNDQCREVFEAENTEDVEKDIRNFVKRLLGRIVFLYFLQKKHWLGASDTSYTDGDTNFLFNLFEADKEQFYTNWLSKLFFKALNTPDRKNDGFDLPEQYFINRSLKESDYLKPNNNQLAIPFLNGGLFEEHQEPKAHKTLKFPGFLFEELFTFFNGYNFTIYENSPEDHTVAVDPEMLGSIFENLLEDNKDKGAFYTPKEIVHFMTQESLIEHLNTHLNHLSKEQLESLVKNQVLDNIENADLIRIEKLIDNVKVCDPAIGSGAFPMGLLQEIFSLKAFIHFALDRPQSEWHPADIKQNIIQNSIYGVDLEEDAVDIARLRFWLSLVVDEEKPKPLPNLDYKIMQGNSLLESFEGIPLNNTNLFNAPSDRNITLFEEPEVDYGIGDDIKKLMDDYFNPKNYRKKQAIHKAIDKKVIDYIDKCLEGFENQKLIELAGAKQSLKRKTELKQKTQPILKEIEQIQDTLNSKGNARKKLVEFEEKSARPYFLWHLFFKDVFEDGGFDIVIGNPPYIQLQKMGKEADKLQLENYLSFTRSGDIYSLFYEKGNKILTNKGVLCYITSNSWLKTKYGESLRDYFINNTNPLKIINFEDTQIFPSATVESNIIITQKSKFKDETEVLVLKNNYSKNISLGDFFKEHKIQVNGLNKDEWIILTKKEYFIKSTIENQSTKIEDLETSIISGIKTGLNKAFLIDKKIYKELITKDNRNKEVVKPIIRGRDISKYKIDFGDCWVIYSHNGSRKENISPIDIVRDYPTLLEYLNEFKPDIEKRPSKGVHWSNVPTGFLNDFYKPKIIWGELSDKAKFTYDIEQNIVEATVFMLTGEKLKYILSILNSKLSEWYFSTYTTTSGMGTNRWKKYKINKFPICNTKESNEKLLDFLIDITLHSHLDSVPQLNETLKNDHIAHFFEEVIDGCVFELYFKEHMLEKGINIIASVQQEIDKVFGNKYFNDLDEQTKNQKIWELYKNLKNSEVQQRMRLFVAKSPDILKPILQS